MPRTPWLILLAAVLTFPAVHGAQGAQGAQGPHTPTSTPEVTLVLDSAPARIPMDRRGNHIYMRGRVNESDSLWIVLDSGASANVIDAGVAKRLGLEPRRMGQGRGAGGVVEAGLLDPVALRLPGATLDGTSIMTMPLEPFRRQTGRPMEVILGAPLFDRCVLRVDYAARMIEILPAGSFEYKGKGIILPLTFEHRLPYVEATVELPGRKPVKGRFVIDLGSSQALILTPQFVEKHKAIETMPRTVEGRGRGVGGVVPSRIGRAARFELGGFTFDQPLTAMPVSKDHRVAVEDAIGNVGGEILRRFTVTFDYPRKRMILEPNAQLGEPFEADKSGLSPRMGPDGSGALEVDWVQVDSPAAEAGIQPNDLIEQVDGKPALEVGVPGLREMFRRDGEEHRLLLRRGNDRIEVSLKTRRLI